MNIVNKLTIRHLKQNKKRTLVTIIGVIISVAMVTAVATLFVSFLNMMQRHNIAGGGEWHVLYKDVNKEQINAIQNDEQTKSVVLSRDRGYAAIDGKQNESKPYLFVKEYNKQGFQQFPIQLSKGRLPKATDEIVISEEIVKNAKIPYKIGDHLKLEVGERIMIHDGEHEQNLGQNDPLQTLDGKIDETIKNKQTISYKIVGIINRPTWEPAWAPGYTIISYVDEDMVSAQEKVDATVVLKKVKRSLYDHAEELAKKNKIESFEFNNNLLRYYGVTNNDGLSTTLFSLSAIIIVVIIIGSVSLIYNAFAISVSERSRHLGMLASVGATRKQKRNSVFFEGVIIGLISIPLGIISGLIGIGITFYFINSIISDALGLTEKLTVVVTPLSIAAACVVSILTIFISTYLPAKKASKITAIDAIRQSTDIKLTGKTVKTSKLVRKLFGIEAEIGLKNLKRNKRRYKATVFSLVISIVLFLTVSFFTTSLKKSLVLSQDGMNYDIYVGINGEVSESDKLILKSIASLKDVTETSLTKRIMPTAWINKEEVADEYKKVMPKDNMKNGKYPYTIKLFSLDEKSLKTYAQKTGADYNKLTNPSSMSGIIIDTVTYQDEESRKFIETKAVHTKVGNSLDLSYTEQKTGKEFTLKKIKVAALTNQLPMGIRSEGLGGLTVIVSEHVFNQLLDEKMKDMYENALFLKSNAPLKTQEEIEEIKTSKMHVFNAYQSRQQEEQLVLLMSVFSYGFIALITAISIANIFNTISTSIALRKREFAMLKSVGMTPKGFNKMINYESIFYGLKSILYGLPISIGIMYLVYKALMNSFSYGFTLPWLSILFCFIAVFIIVSSAMLYSSSKVKKENIIDALKQESV